MGNLYFDIISRFIPRNEWSLFVSDSGTIMHFEQLYTKALKAKKQRPHLITFSETFYQFSFVTSYCSEFVRNMLFVVFISYLETCF